jgi:hypothetical protein
LKYAAETYGCKVSVTCAYRNNFVAKGSRMSQSSQGVEESQTSCKTEYDRFRERFDEACYKMAENYELFYSDSKPRKARIIEIVAKTTCMPCTDRMLREKSVNRIDNFYAECHSLACNILVEELQTRLTEQGYSVLVTDEKKLEYGKVDILIVPNGHGVDLHFNKKEVGIEVKTGVSLSLPQVFRYMLDNTERTLILWRIRNQQILLFEGTKLRPLLTQFMMMIISKAERLLSNPEMSCNHPRESKKWSPSQQQLQEAFSDFADGIIKTLPCVIKTVKEMLDGEQNIRQRSLSPKDR